jgi:hypothetical protein
LRQDTTLEEAKRDIIADQDTQGVPGSPGVAETILDKIRLADIFVADLTPIQTDEERKLGGRACPNPNVMLEYGYALHALGEGKIIGVLNEFHGSPKDLPFDLSHRRWPIRFALSNNNSHERDKEKKALRDNLRGAIRSIISQFDEQPSTTGSPFQVTEPGDGIGRLRHAQDYLCLPSNAQKAVWLKQGPYSFLRFIPSSATEPLGEVEAYKIAQANLQPMGGMRTRGWNAGRHTTGAVSYWTVHDTPELAMDASELFLSRELWANDFYHVITSDHERGKELGFSYIPTGAFEEVLIDTFINFSSVAKKHLALPLPLKVVAGVANVNGVRLAVDERYFHESNFDGVILRDNFIWESNLTDWSVDPFDFLAPFFSKMYDIAGSTRPAVRTTGRRQR